MCNIITHFAGMMAVAAARDAGHLLLEPDQAAKLLVLMGHARSCPGHHTSVAHAEVCVLFQHTLAVLHCSSGLRYSSVDLVHIVTPQQHRCGNRTVFARTELQHTIATIGCCMAHTHACLCYCVLALCAVHCEQVCRSTKFLMLHIRDCGGMLASGEPCPYPWCGPCKV
jgi:hypothetical protein